MQRIQDMMLRALAWAQVRRMEAAEDGQTLVEYALIIALISIATIATMVLLGDQIDKVFGTVKDCLANTSSCPTA